MRYLEDSNLLLNIKQAAWHPQRQNLLDTQLHYDKILNNYLNNAETDVIYLDNAKAFDKVDHQILRKKLHHYDIGGKVSDWSTHDAT